MAETPALETVETTEIADAPEARAADPIATVAQLREAYPELYGQIVHAAAVETEAAIREALEKMTADEFRAQCPTLAMKLEGPISGALDPKKGYILTAGDPFGGGTERHFAQLTGSPVRERPCLIPFRRKASRPTLERYVIRARAAGDVVRVTNAEIALEKCAK